MTRLLSRVSRASAVALALLVWPPAADAQRAILSYSPAGIFTPVVTEAWDLNPLRRAWTVAGLFETPVVVTADGRYAVTSPYDPSGPVTRLTDVLTGGAVDIRLDFRPELAHPRETAVYGISSGRAAKLGFGGLVVIDACQPSPVTSLALSVDGNRLVAVCQSQTATVIDTVSGAVLGSFATGTTFGRLAASANATRVVVAGTDGEFRQIDTTNGQSLASTRFPDLNPLDGAACPAATIDGVSPDHGFAVTTCTWPGPPIPGGGLQARWRIRLLNIDTLSWGVPLDVLYYPADVAVSPDGRDAFIRSFHPRGFGAVEILDTTTGAKRLSEQLSAVGMGVAFPPLTPVLSSHVAGAVVDLRWTLPAASPMATAFRLDAGSAAGLTDLASLSVGPQQSLSIPGVPPGRYYVRLIGVNVGGASPASNELVIEVP